MSSKKNFDEGWAARLVAESNRLTTATYISQALPAHSQILSWVSDMFVHFSEQELPRVRAWVDGGQRYTITDALVKLARRPELALAERLALASGADSYCITFNGLTAWCPIFALEMQREMLSPLFRELSGAPRAGTDFYSFFGNYGYTPFGVHDDTDQSLLWHLGPATKIAYVWPRLDYQRLTGGTLSTLDYQSLLPHARRYELFPGDLLFIPQGDFHLLETRDFSATLGLTLFPDDPALECSEGLRLLAPDAGTLESISRDSLTLESLCSLRRLALESNGHVITSPCLRTLNIFPVSDAMLQSSTISVMPCWPLRAIEIAGREGLLVRRRVLWSRLNGFFKDLCETLNNTEYTAFSVLAAQFAGSVKPAVLLELIRRIYQMGGIFLESN